MRKKSRLPSYVLGGAMVISIVLLLVGSGSAPGSIGGLPHNARTANIGASAGGGNNLAPDFTLNTLDGKALAISSYRGVKPVILDFFATWCPNCRRDIPHESLIYQKYRDHVEVVGVNLQENPATVQNFVSQYQVPFPVVLDPFGTASGLYGVQYTNFHVLIDKTGAVARTIPGDISEADFQALLGV